eukprot:4802501-Lingulodinium_polyedra.AAC.1
MPTLCAERAAPERRRLLAGLEAGLEGLSEAEAERFGQGGGSYWRCAHLARGAATPSPGPHRPRH